MNIIKPEQAINSIQKHLWMWGYRVKNLSNTPFDIDLLVNESIRVKVIESTKKDARIKRSYNFYDVLAVVVEGGEKLYSKGKERKGLFTFENYVNTPIKIIGKPKKRSKLAKN